MNWWHPAGDLFVTAWSSETAQFCVQRLWGFSWFFALFSFIILNIKQSGCLCWVCDYQYSVKHCAWLIYLMYDSTWVYACTGRQECYLHWLCLKNHLLVASAAAQTGMCNISVLLRLKNVNTLENYWRWTRCFQICGYKLGRKLLVLFSIEILSFFRIFNILSKFFKNKRGNLSIFLKHLNLAKLFL